MTDLGRLLPSDQPPLGRQVSHLLPEPVAFVFGGGNARAAAQAGMLHAAVDIGLVPDLVVGSSIGSVSAAAAAADIDTAAGKLAEFWTGIAADTKLLSPVRGALRAFAVSRTARAGDTLRAYLAELLPDVAIDALPTRFSCVATDLVSGHVREIDSGSLIAAVQASAALPVVLPAVTTQGMIMIDGAVVAGVPAEQAVRRGAASLVVFDTGSSSVPEQQVREMPWYETGALAYSHLARGQAGIALAAAARKVPVVVLSVAAGGPLDFRDAPAQIPAGRAAAMRQIDELPPRIRKPGLYGLPLDFEGDELLRALAGPD